MVRKSLFILTWGSYVLAKAFFYPPPPSPRKSVHSGENVRLKNVRLI